MTKWQIHKDMVRSFNGECSVDKLCHLYNKSHGLGKGLGLGNGNSNSNNSINNSISLNINSVNIVNSNDRKTTT